MYCIYCAYTHHDVLSFEVDGMVQNNLKNEYLKNGTLLFYGIKKILNSSSKTRFSEVIIS